MRIVAQFDPANPPLANATSFNAQFSNGTGRIVVHNESNNNIQLSWGSFSTYCPAWMSMLYCVQSNSANINWSIISTLSNISSPISMVVVEAYDSSETIVGTYPAALVRQTNIGNAVNTVGGGSSFIQNDGNPAGTSIVEATPTGDGVSAVQLSNSGVLVLGNATHKGSFSTDNAKIGSDGLGNFTVGGTLTSLGDTSLAQTIKFVNTNPVHIQQLNGADFIFESPANTEVGRLSNAGVLSFIGHMLGDNGKLGSDGNGNFNLLGSNTIVNGTLAGSMTISFPFWSPGIKLMIVTFAGYNGTVKTITLPSSLARGFIFVGDLGGGTPDLQAMVSGGNVSTTAITAFGSSANGTLVAGVAHMFQGAIHNIVSTIDSFQFTPGGVSNGTIILIGH